MPYRYKTHKNGCVEKFPYNLTPAEELETMTRASGVAAFPSRNHPPKADKVKESKEPQKEE